MQFFAFKVDSAYRCVSIALYTTASHPSTEQKFILEALFTCLVKRQLKLKLQQQHHSIFNFGWHFIIQVNTFSDITCYNNIILAM